MCIDLSIINTDNGFKVGVADSDGSLVVSQIRGSCSKDQRPDSQPTKEKGNVRGLNLALTPHSRHMF